MKQADANAVKLLPFVNSPAYNDPNYGEETVHASLPPSISSNLKFPQSYGLSKGDIQEIEYGGKPKNYKKFYFKQESVLATLNYIRGITTPIDSFVSEESREKVRSGATVFDIINFENYRNLYCFNNSEEFGRC